MTNVRPCSSESLRGWMVWEWAFNRDTGGGRKESRCERVELPYHWGENTKLLESSGGSVIQWRVVLKCGYFWVLRYHTLVISSRGDHTVVSTLHSTSLTQASMWNKSKPEYRKIIGQFFKKLRHLSKQTCQHEPKTYKLQQPIWTRTKPLLY